MDAVGKFLATGDSSHLPPKLRPEASGIFTFFIDTLAAGEPPGGPPPGFIDPCPDASPGR